MRKEQHRRLHAGANSSSLPAADCAAGRSSPSACSNAQQAAAAWAWFEHGGSSCITPSKAEGLVAAKGANSAGAGPSRFRKEVLSSRIISRQSRSGSADDHHVATTKPGPVGRRRHSFDHRHHLADRTSNMYDQKNSSSFRSYTSPCFHFDDGRTVDHDQAVAKHEESRNTISCQNEACSLLDKFEVEAVCKQLHDRLSPPCRSPCSSAELHEYHGSQKAHLDHPQEHLNPRRYVKSCSTAAHKPSADNYHHHSINHAVRRLLHLHIKMSSAGGHSTSAAPAVPFFCSSIATTNSIVDHHHHRRSPKHSKAAHETPIDPTAKRQGVLHNGGIRENHVGKVPNYSGELKLSQVSSNADKISAAADKSSRDDGVVAALARSNRHRQLHGNHVHHIHHHHHHYYHHLQQTKEASAQDARRLLQDYYLEGHAGAHELQAPKIYRLHKEKLMISGAADHGEGRPQHHEYIAAPGRLQATAKIKAEKYLWPAAHRAAASTDHDHLQAPAGASLPTF